jgi:hypothetical protein
MGESWLETFQALGGLGNRMQEIGALPIAGLLVASLLSALLMSALYVYFYEGRGTGSQLHRAFPLIGVSVTAIFLAVQFSLPLSLGLLGALSIVRFRTPVKEPEEIGFILLVIATSLCVATFSLVFLGLVIAVATLGLVVLRVGGGPLRRRAADGVLVVTMPADDYRDRGTDMLALLAGTLSTDALESISSRQETAVITYGIAARYREQVLGLQQEIRKVSEGAEIDLYLGGHAA